MKLLLASRWSFPHSSYSHSFLPVDGLLARITQQLRPKRSPTLIPCWDSDLSPAPSLFLASWVLRCTSTSSRSNSSTPSRSLQPSGHYTYRALPAPHTSPLHPPVPLGPPPISFIHSLGFSLSYSVPFTIIWSVDCLITSINYPHKA